MMLAPIVIGLIGALFTLIFLLCMIGCVSAASGLEERRSRSLERPPPPANSQQERAEAGPSAAAAREAALANALAAEMVARSRAEETLAAERVARARAADALSAAADRAAAGAVRREAGVARGEAAAARLVARGEAEALRVVASAASGQREPAAAARGAALARRLREELMLREEHEATVNCQVCFAQPKNVLLQPCGHWSLCSGCADTVDLCPICRAPIAQRLRAFLA